MPSATLPPVTNYIKNLSKSVLFAARDVVKEDLIPDVNDFAEANKEFVKATVSNIRMPKMSDRRNINAMINSKIFQPIDYGFKNVMQDLKSGDFYAKAREDQDIAELAGFDFGDLDDLSEFGIDSDWEKKLESGASASNVITKGETKIAESVERTGAAQAQATVNAIIVGNESVIKNNRANTAVLFQQQEKIFAGMHKDLSVIGATLTSMFKLTSTVMGNIDKNISEYQTQSLKLANEQTAILKEILEMQRNQYKSAQQKEMENARNRSSKRKRFEDIAFGGAVDLEGYFQNIKENIKNEFGVGSDFFDQLKMAMVTPMRDAMKGLFKIMIPEMIKESTKDFSNTMGSLFGAAMGKLSAHKDDFGIMGYIARFLGVNTSVNRNLDTANYEKGPVPWDGISRKALTNVLPGYLSRIEAAITGKDALDYNYNTGKWVRSKDQKLKIDQMKKSAATRATYDLMQSGLSDALNANAPVQNKERKEFDAAIEEFRQFLYDNNGNFYPQESASYNGVSKKYYPNFYKYYNKIAKIYDEYDIVDSVSTTGRVIGRFRSRDGKIHSKSGVKMSVGRNVLQEKGSEERQFRAMEGDSTSSATKWAEYSDLRKNTKHNGKETLAGFASILEYKDKYGFTIHNYLHNINQELIFWRSNFGSIGGSKRRGKKGGPAKSFDSIVLQDNDYVEARRAEEAARQAQQQEEAERNAQNWKKMTFEDIQSGRVNDLRDFRDYRSADFSYQLYRMSKTDREKLFRDLMGSDATMDERALENFFKKQIKGANIRKMEDVQKAIDKANSTGKKTSEVLTAEERGLLGKILNKVGGGKDLFNQLVHAPAEAFTNVLYAADRSVYEMFFKHKITGADGVEFTGFLDMLRGKTESLFDDISKKIQESFKKNIWDRLQKFIKDHKIDEGFKRYTDSLKSIFGVVKDYTVDTFDYATSPARAAAMRKDMQMTRGANWDSLAGRRYSKSGTVIGVKHKYAAGYRGGNELNQRVAKVGFVGNVQEKIQLLQQYGIDGDRINKALAYAKDDAEANEILNKMFNRLDVKQHARGTIKSKPYVGTTMLSKGELLFNRSGVSMVKKTGAYNITTPTDIMTSKDSADLLDSMGIKAGQSRKSVQRDQALENIEKKKLFKSHAGGTFKFDRKDVFNDKEFKNEDVKAAMGAMKANIPEMLAGATVGGGTSLLLGLVGGPLVGAAVGAGAMLIKRSATVQKLLFGSVGADGSRQNDGLINTKIQTAVKDAVNKYAPDVARFGALGLAASLITPLGPVGGLMIGGAIGFLKNNEEMREKLFGKLKIGDSEKSIIRKMLPGALKGAGVGAIATLFGGPFGLMGNAIVGSAIGMMASTDDFKKMMLGEKINGITTGGIIGTIKDAFEPLREAGLEFKDRIFSAVDDNIIDPLANFIQPVIHMLPVYLGALPRMIMDHALNSKLALGMSNLIQDRILQPAGKLLRPAAKLGGTVFRGVTTPFRLVGAVGNKIHKGAIDRRQDDWELASERIAFNTDVLHRDSSKYDLALASIGKEGGMSVEQAKNLSEALTIYSASRQQIHKSRTGVEGQMKKLLNGFKQANGKSIPRKAKSACLSSIQAGSPQKIPSILKGAGLSNDDLQSLMSAFEPLITEWQKIYQKEQIAKDLTDSDKTKMGADIQKVFETQFGIKNLNLSKPSELNKIAKQINMEVENRQGIENAEAPEIKTSENVQDIKDILMQILKVGIKTVSPEDEAAYNQDIKNIGNKFKNKNKGKEDILASVAEAANKGERLANDTIEESGLDPEKLDSKVIDEATRGKGRRFFRSGANRKLFNLPNLMEETFNTAAEHNKMRRLTLISKLAAHVDFDQSISDKLVQISEFNLKRMVTFFAIPEVKTFCKNTKKLTYDEMAEISKFDVTRRNWQATMKARFKLVNKYRVWDQFPSILDVVNMNPEQMRQLQTAGTLSKSNNLPATTKQQTQPQPEPDNHFLGTIIGGALSLGGKLLGGLFKGITSLFGGGNKDQEQGGAEGQANKAGVLSKVMSAIGGGTAKLGGALGSAIGGEADKEGDNASVVQTEYGPAKVTQKADGSVDYDTADNKTKDVVNKLTIKEKMQEKLMIAQTAASDAVSKALEVGGKVKSGAKKGMGWLAALLIGGMLLKSGILGKLWNNIIVPIWKDHVWPWMRDTAFPWIKENVLSPIYENILKPAGDWILNTALPKVGDWLSEHLPGILGTAFGGVGSVISSLFGGSGGDGGGLGGAVSALGESVKGITKGNKEGSTLGNVVNTVKNATGAVFDFFTGTTKRNKRSDRTIDAASKEDQTTLTEMYDEDGTKLTYEDIANGNYNKIYNNEGKEGIVNKDGTVTFDSGYVPGTNWLKKTINTAGHAFTQSDVASKAISAMRGVSGFVAKHTHGLFLGTTAKLNNVAVKATTAPANGAVTLAGKLKNHTLNVVKGAAKENGDDAARTVVEKALGKTLTEGTEAATKKQGKFAKLIEKLSGWLTEGINKLAGLDAFKTKMGQAAIGLMKKPGELIEGFLSHIKSTFDDIIKKGCEKFGTEIAAKVAAKITIILAILQFATDFGIGCDQAENILGVEDPSILETIVAGVVNAIGNLIIVPAIIPGIPETCQLIYKFFGDKLAERQAAAQEAYNKYVEETGSTWSFEEFMKRKYSFTGKVGGFIGDAAYTIKEGIVTGAKAIGNAITHPIETIKGIGTGIANAWNNFWTDDTVTTMENSPSLAASPSGSWEYTRTLTDDDIVKKWEHMSDKEKQNMLSNAGYETRDGFGYNLEFIKRYNFIANNDPKLKPIDQQNIFTADLTDKQILEQMSNPDFAATMQESVNMQGGLQGYGYYPEYMRRYNALQGIGSNAAGTMNGVLSSVLGKASKFGKTAAEAVTGTNLGAVGKALLSINPITNIISSGVDKLTNLADKGMPLSSNTIGQIFSLANGDSIEGQTAALPLGISGVATGIIGLIGHGLSDVKEYLRSTLTDLSQIKTSTTDKIIKNAKDGKLSVFDETYWVSGLTNGNGGLASSIQAIYNGLIRVVNAPGLIITSLVSQLAGFFTSPISQIKDLMGASSKATSNYINQDGINLATGSSGATSITAASANTTSTTSSTSGGAASDQKISFLSKVTSTAGKIVGGIKNTVSNAISGIKNFFGFGKGKYSKQNDPSIASIRYNSGTDSEYQTIGDSGCGPAAAVNAMEAIYGRGTNDIVSASRFALNHGYKETNGGTKPGFFTDYFSRNGVASQTSYNRNTIENQIRSGQPTVLMGRDARGVSNSTPYGKVPHYVTVTGTVGRDYAIVQDPESRHDDQIYRIKDLARKSQIGISTGAGSFGRGKRKLLGFNNQNNRRFGLGKYGRGKSKLIMFGDSKTCGIYDSLYGGNNETISGKEDSAGNFWVCKVGAGLYNSTKSWINGTALSAINGKVNGDYAVVILMGVNDIAGSLSGNNDAGAISDWTDWINKNAKGWIDKGAEVYFMGAAPVEAGGYKDQYADVQNSDLKHFNESVASGVSGIGVKYIDSSSLEGNVKCVDGLHYDSNTYKKVWDLVSTAVSTGQSSAIGGSTSGSTTAGTTAGTVDNRNMLLFEAHYKKNQGAASSTAATTSTTSSDTSTSTTSSTSSDSSSSSSSSDSSSSSSSSGGKTLAQRAQELVSSIASRIRTAAQNTKIHNTSATDANSARAEQRMMRNSNTNNKSNKSTNIFTSAKNALTSVWNKITGKGKYGRGSSEMSLGQFLSNATSAAAMTAVLSNLSNINTGRVQQQQVQEQPAAATTDTSTSTGGTMVNGKYQGKKYTLNDTQITQIANAMQKEQAGDEGIASEASLAANLLETRSSYQNTYGNDFVRFMQNCGWFASVTREAANNTSKSSLDSQSYYDVVKDVLVNGNRMFPQNIDEHDCFSDITSASNNGESFSVSDRSKYQPNVTKLHNKYGSNYTFYAWANPSSSDGDPFGYTGSGGNGIKPRSKFGKGFVLSKPGKVGRTYGFGRGKFGQKATDNDVMKQAWAYFTTKAGFTKEAAAGMLGNIEYESAGDPYSVEGWYDLAKEQEYTKKIDSGEVTEDDFVAGGPGYDGAGPGYGLVQWTWGDLKRDLYKRSKSVNKSIASLDVQLEEIIAELKSENLYDKISKMTNAEDAATSILNDYEKPAERTENNKNRRASASEFYNLYKDANIQYTGNASAVGGTTTGGGATGGAASTNGQDGMSSIGQWLSNVLANSPAAQVLNSFLDVGGSSGSSSGGDAAASSGGTTSTGGTQNVVNGKYQGKKYNLSDAQINGLARACLVEQSGTTGVAAEASLMANLLENNSGYHQAYGDDIVAFIRGGKKDPDWFASDTRSAVQNTSALDSSTYTDVVKDVLVNGNRTMPQFVDEHDMIPDLVSATNNGSSIDMNDRSQYTQDVTKIRNKYKSNYTFWGFPDSASDPFGYTDDALRQSSGIPMGGGTSTDSTQTSGTGSFGRGLLNAIFGRGRSVPLSLTERAKMARAHKKARQDEFNRKAKELIQAKRHEQTSTGNRGVKFGKGFFGKGNRASEVWNWFTTHGYSDSATAGILGNMEQESGVDPEVIQGNGAGPAAGIVQWENYNTKSSRWKNMSDYAASKGRDWTDLESQLEFIDKENSSGTDVFWNLASPYNTYDAFKKATDIKGATDSFEQAFERAGSPMMDNRYTAAQKYYDQFQGTGGTPISGSTSSTGGTSSGGGVVSANGQDGMSSIGQWLSNVLANSPAAQVLNSFLDVGGSSGSSSGGPAVASSGGTSSGGLTGGSGSGAALIAAAQKEVALTDGSNKENPDGSNNCKYADFTGMSYQPWCQSFVGYCANQAGIPDDVIPNKEAWTIGAYEVITKKGQAKQASEAQAGDVIYFTHGGKDGIYHVGIVENTSGGDIHTIEGNSSNMVKRRTYGSDAYSKIMIARPAYTAQSTATTTDTSQIQYASNEGLDSYENTRGGNGIKPVSRFGQFKESLYGRGANSGTKTLGIYSGGTKVSLKSKEGYSTVEYSNMDRAIGEGLKSARRATTYDGTQSKYGRGSTSTGTFYGRGSENDYSAMFKQIVEILLKVATNTDKLNTIVSILQEKLGITVSAQDVSNAQNGASSSEQLARTIMGANAATSKMNTYADTVSDASISSIINAMNAIAAE